MVHGVASAVTREIRQLATPKAQLDTFIDKYSPALAGEGRAVRALIAAALERAYVPIDGASRGRIVIRAISKRQRPRRPALSARARSAKAGATTSR